MKTILYLAMTPNGYIARENDESPWSNEEWEHFSTVAKRVGNLIVGRKTFEIMSKDGDFQELGNPFTLVLSKQENDDPKFINSPEQAITLLKEKGFSEALVIGGGMTNSSFVQSGFVDEIHLDIEPFLFGKGVKLFADADFDLNLKLLKIKKISENTVQLQYKILK